MSRENIGLLKPLGQEDYLLSPRDVLDCLYDCADVTEKLTKQQSGGGGGKKRKRPKLKGSKIK